MTTHKTESLNDRLSKITSDLERHLELQSKLGIGFVTVKTPDVVPDTQQAVRENEKTELLEELKLEALACKRCVLSQMRTKLVFGAGSTYAQLMFIGEAPGYHEDKQGIPFVGPAGQLLTKIIQAINLSRDDVYIANILKCRPPQNRNPSAEETINCYPFLMQQIEIIQPKVIVTLGGVAAKKLLKTERPTGQLRGEFHDFKGAKLMVTYHPAYLLRNPADKRKTWEDMKKVRDYLGLGLTGENE